MKRVILVFTPLLLIALALTAKPPEARAAPAGAATGQTVFAQTCLSNGLVQVSFLWTPSGLGSQWIDVSQSPVFAGFLNAGPLPSNQNFFQWNNLFPNTVYYSRISTWAGFFLTSDAIAFTTRTCGTQFTPPTSLSTANLGSNIVRFSWARGNDNIYFCVDTAFSQDDLLSLTGSWHNWGCGTTGTSVDAVGIACGIQHFWRVFAVGATGSGYSAVATFMPQSCNFSPPSNPRTQQLNPTTVRFAWDRGVDNQWFCVDVATSVNDLHNLTGSWQNFGCLTPSTVVDATGFECDVNYYWRVYARGTSTSGYSPDATFEITDCGFTPPTNLSTRNISPTEIRFRWDAGTDNKFFCVDTATSQEDLTQFKGSWSNNNTCGTTNTRVDIDGLTCDVTYYWRVLAQGTNTAQYSQISTAKTPCTS